MKRFIPIILILIYFANYSLSAQSTQSFEFIFSSVPTSTNKYMYKIYEDSVVLFQEALIVKNYQTRFENRRTDTSNYVHLFCKSEKKILDSIIKVNKLDNISMYEKRSYWGIRSIDSIYIKLDSTEFYSQRWPQWGKSWNVKIKRDYITYSIDLPNYHNSGLEDLLIFVSSLIPEKKKGKYMKY